jgi:hypothetical protein
MAYIRMGQMKKRKKTKPTLKVKCEEDNVVIVLKDSTGNMTIKASKDDLVRAFCFMNAGQLP